jgi:hypothetical protein
MSGVVQTLADIAHGVACSQFAGAGDGSGSSRNAMARSELDFATERFHEMRATSWVAHY